MWKWLIIGAIVPIAIAFISVLPNLLNNARGVPPDTPHIERILASNNTLVPGASANVWVVATDQTDSPLIYFWSAELGMVEPAGPTLKSAITYRAPTAPGVEHIYVVVSNGKNKVTQGSIEIQIVPPTSEPTPTETFTPEAGANDTPEETPTP